MRLARLTALESDKVRSEHAELIERIAALRAILGDPARIDGVVVEELEELEERYGDERRTEITHFEGDMNIEDMIADQQMVISITRSGYVKRLPLATYRQQRRGGIGVMGMDLKEGDYIEHLHICSTHDWMLFFTNRGKVYRLKVYELPEGSRTSKGRALVNVLPLRDRRAGDGREARPGTSARASTWSSPPPRDRSRRPSSPPTTRRSGPTGSSRSRSATATSWCGCGSLQATTTCCWSRSRATPRASREKAVRPMGRDTSGVKGMNVAGKIGREANRVLAMDIARDDAELFVVTENGYGKRTAIAEYPVKGRGTKGVLTAKLTAEEGRAGRGPDRPRAPGPAVHLRERHGAAHPGRRHLADGPRDPGRAGDEPARRRSGQRGRPGGRVRRRGRGGRRLRGRRRGQRVAEAGATAAKADGKPAQPAATKRRAGTARERSG